MSSSMQLKYTIHTQSEKHLNPKSRSHKTFIHLSIQSYMQPSIHRPIHPIHLFIHPSIPFIYSSIHPIHLFIHPSIPFIYSSIHRVCRWYVRRSVGQSVGVCRVSFFGEKKKEKRKPKSKKKERKQAHIRKFL
jgi:hypothetical protein